MEAAAFEKTAVRASVSNQARC